MTLKIERNSDGRRTPDPADWASSMEHVEELKKQAFL